MSFTRTSIGHPHHDAPCQSPDRWWRALATHLAAPHIDTRDCLFVASKSPRSRHSLPSQRPPCLLPPSSSSSSSCESATTPTSSCSSCTDSCSRNSENKNPEAAVAAKEHRKLPRRKAFALKEKGTPGGRHDAHHGWRRHYASSRGILTVQKEKRAFTRLGMVVGVDGRPRTATTGNRWRWRYRRDLVVSRWQHEKGPGNPAVTLRLSASQCGSMRQLGGSKGLL